MTSRWCEPGLTHQISTTGCPAIHVLTLNVTIICEFQLIIKSFHSMKFNSLQICLVYKTPCKVSVYSIYDILKFSKNVTVLLACMLPGPSIYQVSAGTRTLTSNN